MSGGVLELRGILGQKMVAGRGLIRRGEEVNCARVRARHGVLDRHGRVVFPALQSSNWVKSSMVVISEVWAVY